MDDINVLILQAEQGDVNAQRTLGEGYYFGDYGAVDYEKAWKYYSMAAQQGDAHSLHTCGCMLFFGDGRNVDVQNALKYWKASADLDYSYAMVQLAVCYGQGNGVAKNESIADEYWNKAAKLGHPDALYKLAVDFHNMAIVNAKSGNWEVFEALRVGAKNMLCRASSNGSTEAEELLNNAYGGVMRGVDFKELNIAAYNHIRGQ